MLDKNNLGFFKNSNYRDLTTIAATSTIGALIACLAYSSESAKSLACETICGSAYGAYAGVSFSIVLHGLNYYLNKIPSNETPEQEALTTLTMK